MFKIIFFILLVGQLASFIVLARLPYHNYIWIMSTCALFIAPILTGFWYLILKIFPNQAKSLSEGSYHGKIGGLNYEFNKPRFYDFWVALFFGLVSSICLCYPVAHLNKKYIKSETSYSAVIINKTYKERSTRSGPYYDLTWENAEFGTETFDVSPTDYCNVKAGDKLNALRKVGLFGFAFYENVVFIHSGPTNDDGCR